MTERKDESTPGWKAARPPCGCRVDLESYRITYCAMHGAADEMWKALRYILPSIAVPKAYARAEAALAAAEGKGE